MAIPGLVGSGKALVKYDAKAGRFKVDGHAYSSITMIVDIERAEVGWLNFAASVPGFELVSLESLTNGGSYPPIPSKDVDKNGKMIWSRGFRCTVKISDQMAKGGATVREWASNALVTSRAFDRLHDLWLAEQKPGRVPVVSCDQFETEEGNYGDNYRPIFKIAKWIARPEDMLETQTGKEAKVSAVGAPEDFKDELNDSIPW